MNTKNNQRYQQTEQNIMEVFSDLISRKEIRQISVREICEAAHVNRTTFYAHFLDIYDLMEKIERHLMAYSGRIFADPSTEYNLHDRFVIFFDFIREHQTFFRAYLNDRQEIHMLDGIIDENTASRYQVLVGQMGYRDSREFNYHTMFFKAGLTAMVREWLNGGCIETSKELADILDREYQPAARLLF